MEIIKEVIVVEGRDDTNAIKRAVDAVTIETHGFGISKETWEKMDRAYESQGLIIFTDPDHSGEEIRKKLKEKYPDAKEAFLTRNKALSKGDIGIENASPEDIREALSKAKVNLRKKPDQPEFKAEDLDRGKLTGVEDAAERRAALGDILGIGYANAGALLKKLNTLGITREEFEDALEKIEKER